MNKIRDSIARLEAEHQKLNPTPAAKTGHVAAVKPPAVNLPAPVSQEASAQKAGLFSPPCQNPTNGEPLGRPIPTINHRCYPASVNAGATSVIWRCFCHVNKFARQSHALKALHTAGVEADRRARSDSKTDQEPDQTALPWTRPRHLTKPGTPGRPPTRPRFFQGLGLSI